MFCWPVLVHREPNCFETEKMIKMLPDKSPEPTPTALEFMDGLGYTTIIELPAVS